MSTMIDLTGREFGSLLVVELSARIGSKGERYWDCTCTCGRTHTCRGSDLRNGQTTNCGCKRRDRMRELGKRAAKRPFERLYNRLCKSAAKRGIPVEFSYEDFLEFTKQDSCSYCGKTLHWTGEASNLDRADNSKPYTVRNCRPCCDFCNKGKSDIFTSEQWQQLVWFMKDNRDIFGGIYAA